MSTDIRPDWPPGFNRLFGKRASRRTDFSRRSFEFGATWYDDQLAIMRECMPAPAEPGPGEGGK